LSLNVIGLLALANIAFGVSGYLSPDALFQNSKESIDLASLTAKYAGYEFASRNLGHWLGSDDCLK